MHLLRQNEAVTLLAGAVAEEAPNFELIGGISAALAIAAALFGTVTWLYRHFRRKKLLTHLSNEVRAVQRIDDTLRDRTWKMERLFTDGFPWTGYAIFTGAMGDHLDTLQGTAREVGDVVARTRALDASGADERLRLDVERLAEGLRQVIPLYIWGIVSSYRGNSLTTENEKEATKQGLVRIPASATGREPTRTLRFDDRAMVRDLRLHLRVLFRSITMRLRLEDLDDAPFATWPIDMAEAYEEEARLRGDLTVPYGT